MRVSYQVSFTKSELLEALNEWLSGEPKGIEFGELPLDEDITIGLNGDKVYLYWIEEQN